MTRKSVSLDRIEVTLHLFPTEATKGHSGSSFPLHMIMVPFFRISGYLLVFLKSTSRYVGKDIWDLNREEQSFHVETSIMYQHKPNYPADVPGEKFYSLCLKKCCTLTWVCLGGKTAQHRHPLQTERKDGNRYQFHRSASATITCKSKETNTKVGIVCRRNIKQQEETPKR